MLCLAMLGHELEASVTGGSKYLDVISNSANALYLQSRSLNSSLVWMNC